MFKMPNLETFEAHLFPRGATNVAKQCRPETATSDNCNGDRFEGTPVTFWTTFSRHLSSD